MDILRRAEVHVQERLRQFPAVALLGPRQVGKTTMALAIAESFGAEAVYLDLERPSDRAKLDDPELYLQQHDERLVILDEIHRAPGLFEVLRGLIDARRRRGRRVGHFLLLGSASMDLMQQSSETLAGRIAYEELTPFLIQEVSPAEQLWTRGGFPESFLAPSEDDSYRWRQAFIQTYLERDVPSLGPRIPAETLRRVWQMLAHNQGQLLNAAQLAGSLGISGHTAARYLDVMVDLLLVRRLQPWFSNAGKRLVKSPKVYVRDSGLTHALLGIGDTEQLMGHPVVGASWEGFVIENIFNCLKPSTAASFYRSSNGAEIDLVLDFGRQERWAIEIKRSLSNPAPTRGFYQACMDIEASRRVVVYPGSESYPLNAETTVLPVTQLLAELQSKGA